VPSHDPTWFDGAAVTALLVAFGVIFVAELGDKSQLMTLAFATRHRAAVVLGGLLIAQVVLMSVAVVVGTVVADQLPTRAITIGSGLLFLGFAAWALRDDGDEIDDAAADAGSTSKAPLAAITLAYLVAELGDKTQLAAITLATQQAAFPTFVGAVAGVLAANVLAIVVGRVLHRRLPADTLRYGAAALFALFGVLLLVEGIRG